MKKTLHVIWSVPEIIIIIYVICLTTILLAKNKFGFTQLGDYVLTSIGSNDVNNIINTEQGDLLIIKNTSDLNVGDVIYYYAVYDEKYIICSDVVKSMQKDDFSALYTIDDQYNSTVHSDKVIGKYTSKYHKLGNYFSFLQSRVGFLFFVLLPIMVVFIYQIYDFTIILKYGNENDDHDDEEAEDSDVEPEIEKNKFEFQNENK